MIQSIIDYFRLREVGYLFAASPLRSRRVLAFVVTALLLLLLIASLYTQQLRKGTPLLIVMVALAGSGMLSQPGTWLLGLIDSRSPRPFWLRWASKICGSLVSVGLVVLVAGTVNGVVAVLFGINLATGSRPTLFVPFWAELGQGLVLLILSWLLRDLFDNLRDGLVIGAFVGLGYLIAETTVLIGWAYTNTIPISLTNLLVFQFGLLGLSGPTLWGALLGASIGLGYQSPNWRIKIGAPLIGLILAIQGHILHWTAGLVVFAVILRRLDATQPLDQILNGFAPLQIWLSIAGATLLAQTAHYIIAICALLYGIHWERQIIQRHLADEIGTEMVTAEEYAALISGRRLRRGRAGRRIAVAQTELALRKWRITRAGGNSQSDPQALLWRRVIAYWRGTIRNLKIADSR